MNQITIVKKRKRINMVLFLVLCVLLAWVGVEFTHEINWAYQNRQPLTAKNINIQRDDDSIQLSYLDNQWLMIQPYQEKASRVVIETLLEKLKRSCREIAVKPTRTPQIYAEITVDKRHFRIGEINHTSDEVYVQHEEQWLLCDKLLASMALAPAINFIDKQLYHGDLKSISGDFGTLTDFSGIDLSVMEIAPADEQELPQIAISSLLFTADNQREYQAFLHEDGKHLLLFDASKSLIYVVAAHPKLNAILGL